MQSDTVFPGFNKGTILAFSFNKCNYLLWVHWSDPKLVGIVLGVTKARTELCEGQIRYYVMYIWTKSGYVLGFLNIKLMKTAEKKKNDSLFWIVELFMRVEYFQHNLTVTTDALQCFLFTEKWLHVTVHFDISLFNKYP